MEATPNGPAGHALLSGGLVHFVTVETGQLLIYCWRMQVNLDKKGLAGPAWDKAAPALVAPVDLDGIGPIATHTWWLPAILRTESSCWFLFREHVDLPSIAPSFEASLLLALPPPPSTVWLLSGTDKLTLV